MDLMKALEATGQQDQILNLVSEKLGLDGAQAGALMGQVLNSLGGGVQSNAQSSEGLQSLLGALMTGGHDKFVNQPETALESQEEGNKILGHVLGGKEQSRAIAQNISQSTSIETQLIKALLPIGATILMGVLSKNFGISNPQGLQGFASLLGSGGAQSGDLMGGLTSLLPLLDMNQNGTPIDDIMKIVGGLNAA